MNKPAPVKYPFDEGDFFSVRIKKNIYAYGRILTKFDYGHVIEFYELFGKDIVVPVDELNLNATLFPFNKIIDSYSLFVKNKNKDWRVTSFKNEYTLEQNRKEEIQFHLGFPDNFQLIDLNRNKIEVSNEEAKKYPPLGPSGDVEIKRLVNFWREKKALAE